MRRGRFIAFEGGEGSGKSTQARLLADALAGRGIATELTREPGGTPGAEAIRSLLLEPPGEEWGAPAEALLFAAARADHVARLIKPALDAGRWVVCDRFVDSSRAYQGGAGGVGDEAVLALHAIGSDDLRPDLTILIDIPPQIAAQRLLARDAGRSDAIGGRDARYHAKVAEAFRAFAGAEPNAFAVVAGDASPEQVHARVLDALSPFLSESAG